MSLWAGKRLSQLVRDHFQTEKILSFHPSQLASKKFLRLWIYEAPWLYRDIRLLSLAAHGFIKDALDIPEIDTIYATEINAEFPDADTFFPEIDIDTWKEVSRAHHPADTENNYDFDFVTYKRK